MLQLPCWVRLQNKTLVDPACALDRVRASGLSDASEPGAHRAADLVQIVELENQVRRQHRGLEVVAIGALGRKLRKISARASGIVDGAGEVKKPREDRAELVTESHIQGDDQALGEVQKTSRSSAR